MLFFIMFLYVLMSCDSWRMISRPPLKCTFLSYSPMWGGPFLNFPRNLSRFINIFAPYMWISSIVSSLLFEKGPHPNSNIQVEKGPHPNSTWTYTTLFIFRKTDYKLQSTLLHQCFICCWHIELVDIVEIYIAPTFHIILQSLETVFFKISNNLYVTSLWNNTHEIAAYY